MSTDRDTHFLGFAKLLVDELAWLLDADSSASEASKQHLRDVVQTLIARRAYDLLYFQLDNAPYFSGSFDTGHGTPEEIGETISHLPDLTAPPAPQSDSPAD